MREGSPEMSSTGLGTVVWLGAVSERLRPAVPAGPASFKSRGPAPFRAGVMNGVRGQQAAQVNTPMWPLDLGEFTICEGGDRLERRR